MSEGHLYAVGINRSNKRVAYDHHEAYMKDFQAMQHAYEAHPDFSYPCNVELPSGLWISMVRKDTGGRTGFGFTEQEAVNNRMGKDNLDFSYDVVILEDEEAKFVADNVAEHMAQRRAAGEDLGVARKDDSEKARYDLVPGKALYEVAQVFTFGAKKYAAYNYRGLDYSRIYAAAQRHMNAWWMGEEEDEETGISHLAHAVCCMMMLRDIQEKHAHRVGQDDRP